MTRKLLVGAIVAGALTVTAGTAFALSRGDTPSSATPTTTTAPTSVTTSASTPTSATSTPSTSTQAPAELSADDAARIVRERMGGTVHEIEREIEHGRLEWKVEITARDGVTYDVRVDAATGDFTRVDQDDRDDDRGRHGGDDDRDDHDDD